MTVLKQEFQRMMEVRRIRAHEGPCLRALRLRALADAPTAFGSSLAEAQAHPQDYWDSLAWERANAQTSATFVVEEHERWYGMVGCFIHQDHPDIVRLVSMWVDPTRRRSGMGTALVDAVVQWASACGAKCVQLWVTDTNHRAKSLYARTGFIKTEHTKPLPSNPTLQEVLMVRELTVQC
jgi:ribosomal protein S18 acetylase RimI-like enzyme